MISPSQIAAAVSVARSRISLKPQIGIVLGSGLSGLADAIEDAEIIHGSEIPNWPSSTVEGHTGRLVIGRLSEKNVLVLQGRSHFYEGHSIHQVTLPVRVMAALGVRILIVTNAAGGINREFKQGDLMVIRDHINFPGLAGFNPLRGPNDDQLGLRFPDMTHAYDPDLRRLAHEVAAQNNFSLREGVYTFVAGPSFETPAELRLIQVVGGDAVGMSTVPSVLVARHAGLRVLGISSITNMTHLDPAAADKTSHEEVMAVGREIIPRLETLLRGILEHL